MKLIRDTILPSVLATSAMTLFSYIVSDQEGENFREPALLGEVLKRNRVVDKQMSHPLGWVSHYAIGIGFGITYKLLLKVTGSKPSATNGTAYGSVGGVTGILWWAKLFKNNPNPPKIDKKGFYTQLFIAHLIFGLTLSSALDKKTKGG